MAQPKQFRNTKPIITARSRNLRRELTNAEKKLWYHLRLNQLKGCKFRRQHPIGNYIVDFVCIERKLIIELDGGQHATQQDYDKERDAFLQTRGYTVIRFWNNAVMENLEGVLIAISDCLTRTPT